MQVWQGARTALVSIAANKLRSTLTILGIVIGVAAVIALVSIGRGAQAQITAQIESNGTNLVYVRPGSAQQGGVAGGAGTAGNLTEADAEALYGVAGVAGVAPEMDGVAQVTYLGQNTRTRVVGVTPDFLNVRNLTLTDGEFISSANVIGRSSVVVLGSTVAETLFGGTGGVVGQSIRVNGQPYRVVGVLASKGGSGFGNQDDQILVPLTTAQTRLIGGNRFRGANVINVINVQVASADEVQATIDGITLLLRERHRTVEGSDDFSVQNQQDILATATQVTNTLTIFLGGIAAISLLVGGIGIMNIMLVSVTERTREIGIRMAIGARQRDVLAQFLLEALMISIAGCLIGLLLGIGGALLTNALTDMVIVISGASILVAFAVAAGVGIFFGYYPAHRAAALDPIEALRHQ